MVNISSTNRGYERHKSDYYVTPIEEIVKFIDAFVEVEKDFEGSMLDPTAGGDNLHPMSYPTAFESCGYKIDTTIDIRQDSLADIKTDYLTWKPDKKYNVIISNPPFHLALPIIKKALKDAQDNGWVIMLLRLNFFGSKSRKVFWNNYMPKYVFVHHKRMSFTDNGKMDSIEYCHMCFQKGFYPEFTKMKVI